MDLLLKNKKLLIGLGAVVLIAIGYFMFFDKGPTPDVTASVGAGSPSEFFFSNLESQLDPISFDTSIFSDPRFTALVDIRTAITPETAGRADPFASLPGVAAQ